MRCGDGRLVGVQRNSVAFNQALDWENHVARRILDGSGECVEVHFDGQFCLSGGEPGK